jgi:hypothetical protein
MVIPGAPARRRVGADHQLNPGESKDRQRRRVARSVGCDRPRTRLRTLIVVVLVAPLSIATLPVRFAAAAAVPDGAFTNLFASLSRGLGRR